MLSILAITFPVFVVIALGYATTRFGLFKPADMRVFGRFVMTISLPALLFNAVARRDLSEVFNPGYIAVYAGAALVMIGLGLIWFRGVRRLAPTQAAIALMGTTTPNSGYIAYPIMLLALPEVAGVVLALNIVVENLLVIPLCLALVALGRRRDSGGVGSVVLGIFRDLLRRPLVIALLAALAVSLSGVPLPAVVERLTALLAMAASPLALFVIGGALVGLPMRGERLLAAQVVVGKLFVHPLVVMALVLALPLLSLAPLSPDMRAAVLLTAAVPMMGIYPIFAQEEGQEGMASMAILGATLVSFFSVSALLAVLG
jgi:hypothetical protein